MTEGTESRADHTQGQKPLHVDATEFKDSGTAAIKHIESLLLKYGHD